MISKRNPSKYKIVTGGRDCHSQRFWPWSWNSIFNFIEKKWNHSKWAQKYFSKVLELFFDNVHALRCLRWSGPLVLLHVLHRIFGLHMTSENCSIFSLPYSWQNRQSTYAEQGLFWPSSLNHEEWVINLLAHNLRACQLMLMFW